MRLCILSVFMKIGLRNVWIRFHLLCYADLKMYILFIAGILLNANKEQKIEQAWFLSMLQLHYGLSGLSFSSAVGYKECVG